MADIDQVSLHLISSLRKPTASHMPEPSHLSSTSSAKNLPQKIALLVSHHLPFQAAYTPPVMLVDNSVYPNVQAVRFYMIVYCLLYSQTARIPDMTIFYQSHYVLRLFGSRLHSAIYFFSRLAVGSLGLLLMQCSRVGNCKNTPGMLSAA